MKKESYDEKTKWLIDDFIKRSGRYIRAEQFLIELLDRPFFLIKRDIRKFLEETVKLYDF